MIHRLYIIILLSVLLASCTDTYKEVPSIRIATAANMQFAMDSIALLFEKEHGIECQIASNSSGMLTAQIEKGAPFDVFVSANMFYPNQLMKKGLADPPTTYAYGRLALICDKNDMFASIEEVLSSESVKRIAVANPKTAPYGIAATEFLKSEKLLLRYKDKIVYGESIGQVNQYITTGAVDAAFTSFSFVTMFGSDYQVFEVDADKFTDIKQGVVVLKRGNQNNPEESKTFVEFLKSENCQKVLEHFGYRIN